MNQLNYRLLSPTSGSSLSASTTDPELERELFCQTLDLVSVAFAKMHLPNVPKQDKIPEVISQTTLDHIERLESALEACRNLMIDSDAEDDDMVDDWKRAIDEAEKALGYPA